MARNIEIKAHCPDIDAAQAIAGSLGTTPPCIEHQRDTYFETARGRLKLRQRWLQGRALPSQLIAYQRADAAQPRPSDYMLVETDDGDRLRAVLASALGVRVAVDKERTVYIHDYVRIHLDRVDRLGPFIELEAIVDATCDDAQAHEKLAALRVAFGITDDRLVRVSYADLLER